MTRPAETASPALQRTAAVDATSAAGPAGMASRAIGKFRGPGTGGGGRYFFIGIWLIYLVEPISNLFSRSQSHGHSYGHGVLYIAGGLLITAVFCAIYLPIMSNVDRWPRAAQAALAALAVLTGLACVVYGHQWTPLWIYVATGTGLILTATRSRRAATLGVVVTGALYSFFCWLSHQDLGDYLAVLIPVLLVGLAMIGFRLQMVLMRELAEARETVARLAANTERLRLARDMHDLTGQSLSMITLKSELAAKRLSRLPASADRDAAATELGDIGRVSRQTLHDIREAVSGYRRPTLAIEVITARNAVEAAGVALDDDAALTLRSGTFDPDAEAALAWCLREAITNVIRHSRARNCRIRLTERHGELSLTITDDGQGLPQGAGPAAPEPGAAPGGSGLRGMSERLSAVGGHLSLGSQDAAGRGFRLVATVPMAGVPARSGHNDEV